MADAPDLFDRAVAAGQAAFSLASLDGDAGELTEREQALVKAAIEAGVLGALDVLRDV